MRPGLDDLKLIEHFWTKSWKICHFTLMFQDSVKKTAKIRSCTKNALKIINHDDTDSSHTELLTLDFLLLKCMQNEAACGWSLRWEIAEKLLLMRPDLTSEVHKISRD